MRDAPEHRGVRAQKEQNAVLVELGSLLVLAVDIAVFACKVTNCLATSILPRVLAVPNA